MKYHRVPRKRRVVVQRVVAMSHCRSLQIEGLAYKRFVVLSLATRRQDESPTTRRLSLAPTRRTKAYQISHHTF
jgi:hypothetical protein